MLFFIKKCNCLNTKNRLRKFSMLLTLVTVNVCLLLKVDSITFAILKSTRQYTDQIASMYLNVRCNWVAGSDSFVVTHFTALSNLTKSRVFTSALFLVLAVISSYSS